jgi:GntR family transcriptional regulator
MDITIHANAPEPVYEQIVRQIHEGVKSGVLEPGTPLPTVRQLAADLSLNRNTVARAYKMLEDQGVIVTAGRKGTFVRQDAAREVAELKADHALRAMRHVIETLIARGLNLGEISVAFNEALGLEARRGEGP